MEDAEATKGLLNNAAEDGKPEEGEEGIELTELQPKPAEQSKPKRPRRAARPQTEEEEWSDEEEELTFEEHASMVLTILKPVAITMILVIWAVRVITIPTDKNFTAIYMVYSESPSDPTTTKLFGALLNALVFVVMIILVTVVFVILYKYRCLKLIFAWLIASSGMMLALFGSLIAYLMIRSYNLPVDSITFSIAMWNFSVIGVICIFWYGPRRLNQAYLVLISAFLAIFFTRLPEWTTWAILATIALYDVFAVLCPRGPLRVLVETAQERQEAIPALLYSGSVFPLITSASQSEGLLDEDKSSESVKLGLGDFVFYSVLVGRASMFDWLTVSTCFIAIITGLFWTLLLLAVFRKALPALPISIALGILFYFLTKVFLLPFVLTLGVQGIMV